ncbi:acyl-CoA synthetase [Nocardia sp. NPDC049526]|uniref:acyl-CoA synthetase n=1 Tax=Nocardia sp. NPDC049526 TaxID=3364316 RepID=UPI0037B1DBFF
MYPGAFATTHPDRPAVIMAETGETITYRTLEDHSIRFANHLAAAGIRPGDVLAMLTDNVATAFEVYWGAIRSGLHVTAVNHHLAPAEIAYIIADSGARALVVSAAKAALAAEVLSLVGPLDVHLVYGGAASGFDDYRTAIAAASPVPPTDQPRGIEMLYSSGTTGTPKGVRAPLPGCQVHELEVPVVAMLHRAFALDEDTVYLSPAPIYHAAPLRWAGAVHSAGGTVVMLEQFDAERCLAAIERYRPTHAQFVPTMFIRMLKLPKAIRERHDLSSLKLVVHAAAPCPAEVKTAMIDWLGPKIVEYYSATEANGVTIITSAEAADHPGSVGKPALGIIHICDAEGHELPTGSVGTVYFERETLPFRYHNDDAKTQAAQHPDHPTWTAIGDLGRIDTDGYLYLADRQDFVIISGGVNIYPQEVENALALHPEIRDVAVIGIPDPEMGQSVHAVVEPVNRSAAGPKLAAQIIAFARARIAHFKAPKTVEFVDELPRTPTGKLVKGRLTT